MRTSSGWATGSCVRALLLRLAAGNPGDDQRDQDDRPVQRGDPLSGHARQGQHVLDHVEQQDAREGAEHRAAAPVQADPADDRRREDGEDRAVALRRGHRGQPARQHQPAERGQDARPHEGAPQHAVGADPRRAGRVHVATDRVQRTAETGVAEHQDSDDEQQQAEVDRYGDAEPQGRTDVEHRIREAEERLAAGDPGQQAAQHDQHAEGDDEAVEPEPHDEGAVDQADHHPDRKRDRHARPAGQQPESVGDARGDDQPRGDAGREPEGGLQREIHLACDQHERLRQHEEADLGHGLQDVDQIVAGEEDRVDRVADHGDGDDRGHQGQVAQPGEHHGARARTGSRRRHVDLGLHPRTAHSSIPSIAAISSLSLQPAANSVTTRPPNITRTRSQVRRSSSSSEATSTADPASRTRSTTSSSVSFERTSTPAVGWINTSRRGSLASARPITTFCWLPPDSAATSSSGPGVLTSRSPISLRAKPSRTAGRITPYRPRRSGTVIVMFSAIERPDTKPCWCRSWGTRPTPAPSAALTLPEGRTRPSTLTVPPGCGRSPTTASAISRLPLPPPPARPTTSPDRTSNEIDCASSNVPSAAVTRTSRTDSTTGADDGTGGRGTRRINATASPVIAATTSRGSISATRPVATRRASRKTVTSSQMR